MAKKTRVILVNKQGGLMPPQVTVKQSDTAKIKWLPDTEGELITISFDPNKIPFDDSSWTDGKKKGTSVTGKLKKFDHGSHTFDYEAKGWARRTKRVRNPKLIVEGGRRKAKKKR